MRRKARRRPVHYLTFAFPDRATVACTPTRKPSKRRIKEHNIHHVDADFVIREYLYSAKEFHGDSDAIRGRMADLLANRLNMRRTVRELVLPSLAKVEATLQSLKERLEHIEQGLA